MMQYESSWKPRLAEGWMNGIRTQISMVAARPTLWPSQSPLRCVYGTLPGVRRAGAWSWPLTSIYEVKNTRATTSLHEPHAPLWRGNRHENNLHW